MEYRQHLISVALMVIGKDIVEFWLRKYVRTRAVTIVELCFLGVVAASLAALEIYNRWRMKHVKPSAASKPD